MSGRWANVKQSFLGNPYAYLIIILIPAIQYGVNYLVSVATLLFVLLILNTRKVTMPKSALYPILAWTLSIVWAYVFISESPNFAREMRFALGLASMFYLFANPPKYDLSKFDGRWILAILVTLFLYTLMQTILAQRGIYVYIPTELFVKSDDWSLGDAWVKQAIEHGYDVGAIRSPSFYSEPSYLGGVCLFLQFIALHSLPKRLKVFSSILAIVTCFISGTVYGIITNSLIAILFYTRRLSDLILPTVIFAIGVFLAMFFSDSLYERFQNIISGDDESSSLRILQPFDFIEYVLVNHPFGVVQSISRQYFESIGMIKYFEDAPFQNGMLNLIIGYGWMGLGLIYLILRQAGGGLCAVLILFLMMQNGAALDFDKVVMYVFSVHIFLMYKQKNAITLSNRKLSLTA